MKTLIILVFAVCVSAQAALIQLNSAQDFENLIESAEVPVLVQFSAYWCGPCQNLKATLRDVAQSYSDEQVRLAIVDAYVNSSLGHYLQGGYPTVRTFKFGSLTSLSFVGSKPGWEVRQFIDQLVESRDDLENEEIEGGPFCPVATL